MLSYGDLIRLNNSVLTSLPILMLSFLEILVGVRKRVDFLGPSSFGKAMVIRKKNRLTKWDIIYRHKDQGGLGVEDLELKNKFFLSKWFFKLMNEEGFWQELLHNNKHKTLSRVFRENLRISHFGRV
jgi:hypothetical protein